MNSRERVQAALAGEVPDRAPVCLHNSHLAAAQAGISMSQYRKDPMAIAQAHLQLAAEGIFTVVHTCGDTAKILESLAEYDCCGFEFDHKTDPMAAQHKVGARHVLFGNVDPSAVLALGTPALVRQKTRELISVWKPQGRFVLNSGCALPSSTPPENIRAFIETAHEFGVYT